MGMGVGRVTLVVFTIASIFSIGLISFPTIHQALGAPGSGTLFGTDASDGNLISVNTVTGIANIVGPMGGAFPSLAFDHTTNTMFAGSGGGAGNLYTVTTGNGATNLVATSNLGGAAIGGMDVNVAGTLYAAVNIVGDGGTGSDHLATIDKNTGQATIIGPFGNCVGTTLPFPHIPSDGSGSCTIDGIEGIAFDTLGNLWGVHSARGAAGAPGLYTINIGTGAVAFSVPLLDALGAPASGGFVSIQYACDGTLFGGTARDSGGAGDGGFLATINPGTGIFTLAPNGATGGTSLGGLAFGSSCGQLIGGSMVPMDKTALLLAGAQSISMWMIPVVIAGVSIGIFVVIRKK